MGLTRAIWFNAPRAVEVRTQELGCPGAGEIQVEALISGISHGTEMLVYRGQVPPDTSLDLPTLAGSFAYPIKYGYASVGRVEVVGDGVESVSPGDLVFALHPHQERFVVPSSLAWPLGDVPPERGIFTANLETALNVLLDAPIRIGDHVVVVGQGVVGLLIGLLARRSGAGRVVVVDPFERRRQAALSLGADAAIAPSGHLLDHVRSAANDGGPPDGRADVVFEASGNPAALESALDCVTEEGTVVVCSWYGTKPVTLDLGGRFHRARVRVRSSQVGRVDPSLAPRWDVARRTTVVRRLLRELPLERLISHRVPFDEAERAYKLVDEQADEVLQVVLTYG